MIGGDGIMNIKAILRDSLKKTTDKMVTSSKASFFGYGVEEMPKSMKEKR